MSSAKRCSSHFCSREGWSVASLLLGLTALASNASASPWILEPSELAFNLGYDFQNTNREYLPGGRLQRFPLNGRFLAHNARFGFRYGLAEHWEVSASTALKSVVYDADPVVLVAPTDKSLGAIRGSVLDFGKTVLGFGDVYFEARYNLYTGPVLLTNQIRVKLPTGYARPRETLVNRQGDSQIADDVALGDGQVDIEESLLFGAFIEATRMFTRVDVGFRYRAGSPGHQLIGGAKIGKLIGDSFTLFLGAHGSMTLVEGEVIGETITSVAPRKSALDFDVNDIRRLPLTLDKDYLQATVGVVWVVDLTEVAFSYSQILVGKNVPAIRTLSISTAYSFGQDQDDE